MNRRRLVSICASALMLAATQTGAMECEFDDIAILGTNSVYLQRDTNVTGDVVVNDASPGPVLSAGVELDVDRGAAVTGNLSADSIDLSRNTTINGDVSYNELIDRGAGGVFTEITPLALPVFDSLPAFQQAVVRPEPTTPHDPGLGEDVFVAANTTVTLTTGEYGDITIEGGGSGGGTLVFSGGGVFNVRSIGVSSGGGGQCAFPCRSVEFDAPTDLRVVDRIDTERNGYVGTTGGAGVGASQILIYVGGVNGSTGTLAETPKAVQIGRESTVLANVYAPNGTVLVEQGSTIVGALIARDVDIQKGSTVTGDSGFVNEPPTADPQTVFTNGDQNLNILLTASDPEGADLTFSIVAGFEPMNGTILSITPIVPDPVTVIDRETGEEITIQPPITSAIAVYDPDGGEDKEDGFTFEVTDDCGNTGMAVVTINPFDPSPDTPPLDAVEADDIEVDVIVNATVEITLDAGGPDDVTVAYSIESLPTMGTLTDSADNTIASAPHPLTDATVFYTADAVGMLPSSDQFNFLAFDDQVDPQDCAFPDCATATVLIGINRQVELAEDQMFTTNLKVPLTFTLTGNPGGSGTPLGKTLKVLPGADIAGNVSDADGNGLGDGRDNLPGPAPVLVAAGVDVNLGAASSGSTTESDSDAIASSTPDPDPDVISATVSTDGTDLTLQVRYKAGTFDLARTRAQFLLDTDQNPATGHPGTNAGCVDDAGIIGSEFIVNMGGDVNGTNAGVSSYNGTCNSFSFVGNGTVTYVTDGMDATVPLSLIGGDDGKLNYKVTISEQNNPGSGGSTGVLDTMPDVGLPAVDSNPGVEGVARIQIEWNISGLDIAASEDIESASVTLNTEKGTADELDTMFFVGTEDGDGMLSVDDFETEATEIDGLVMPVPAGSTGTQGTFSFNVTNELKSAVDAGFDYFTLQGRVDEQLAGGGFRRGLQIRSTATGNLTAGTEPQLDVVIMPDTGLGLIFEITSLPTSGTVKTLTGEPVIVGDTFTEPPTLLYTPSATGTYSLTYQVTEGSLFDSALVEFVVDNLFDACAIVGRPPGCTPD